MSNLPYISTDLVKTYQSEIAKSDSPATTKRRMSSLKKFFGWAAENGHLPSNPIAVPPLPVSPVGQPPLPPDRKKGLRPSHIFAVFTTVALIILIFLLLGKLKLPIPFRFAPASNDTSITVNNGDAGKQTIIASAWTVFAKLGLTNQAGQPITTLQSISFKIYSAESGGTAVYSSPTQTLTPDASGVVQVSLNSVPTEVFFENDRLYLAPVTTEGETSKRLPINSANVAANLQGYYPNTEGLANTIPVIDNSGALVLASASPVVKAKNGNLLIEGQVLTLATPTASDGDINLNPDGSGNLNVIFEGTSGNLIDAKATNLTSGALYSGTVANSATGYYLIRLQSGSTPVTRFSVDALGNTNLGGALQTLGVTRLTSSGQLTAIKGYSQDSGNFMVNQLASDYLNLNKSGVTAATDSATLTLDETGKTQSNYDTLVLNRIYGGSEAYALYVKSGNANFGGHVHVNGSLNLGGELQLGNFSSAPTAMGTGSMIYNTSDNQVYFWNGTAWISSSVALTVPFSGITSGTNTTAAMVVGTGSSLTYHDGAATSGEINASLLQNAYWAAPLAIGTTTPAAGNFTSIGVTTQGTGAFTTLTSSGNSTIGTGASSINTIGSGTTPGTLNLHGATTLDNTFTVSGSNLTSLGGNLTVTGTAWTATPTISGLITATLGLTSNGAVTVQNNSNLTQTGSGTFGTGTGAVSLNGDVTIAANKNLTLTSGTGVYSQTFSGTTQAPFTLAETFAPSAGGTQIGLTQSVTNNPSTSANTLYGRSLSITESSNLANTINGERIRFTDAGTGASTKVGLDVDVTTANANDTTYAALFNGGNVGIGNTTPTEKLDITGNLKFSAALMPNNLPGTSGQFLISGGAGASPTWTSMVPATSLKWNTLTTPDGNLSLAMSTFTTGFNWATGTGANNLFSFTTDASANGTGALLNLQTGASSTVLPLRVRAGSVEGLTVNASGNVGIGTTNPQGILHVNTPDSTKNIYLSRTSLTDAFQLRVSNNGADDVLLISNASSDTAGLAIQGDGKIGIGTASPGTAGLAVMNGNVGIGDITPASLLTVGAGDLFQVDSSGRIVAIDGVAHTIEDVSGNLTLSSNSTSVVVNDSLAVNGAGGITSTQATLIINAGGNVDIQDALNADLITSDAGVSIAASNSYTGAGAVTLSSAAGTVLAVDSGTTGAINIGTGANSKTITIGNTSTSTSVVLTKGASGNITLTGYNCWGGTNNGKLTTDSSGNLICGDDIGGAGATNVPWSGLTDPTANLTLSHSAWTTTMNWTATGALSPWTMNLTNNAGVATTQNFVTIANAATSQTGDINTEALLTLDNADTSGLGLTVVDNAILITNSGAITNGITDAIDASATEIVNALNFGTNTILGTTGNIDMNNFDVVGSTGNVTTAGTLAVNGAGGITSTQSTLIINASGNVDVQDALNADSITSDAGVSIANGSSYTGAGAVILTSGGANNLSLDTGGIAAINIGSSTNATSVSICNSTNCDLVTIGINADADTITIGEINDNVSITDAQWSITGAGAASFVGVNSGSGLLQGTGGLTVTGTVSINNNATTNTTSIGGGTTTGTVTLGGTGTQTLDIGNGAGVKTVNLGSNNTTSTTNLLSGSGAINLNVSNNQPTNINTGTSTGTVTVGGTGIMAINIGAGGTGAKTISIGDGASTGTINVDSGSGGILLNDAVNNPIGIGTGTSTGTITLGGTGTQTLNLGNGAGIKTINLGSNTTTSATTILSGTTSGVLGLNVSAGGALTNIGTGTTTGTVTLGGTGTQTLDIGNGVGVKTVNLGSSNTTSTTNLLSGSGAINLNVSNNQPTNINTGTSTGTVTVGGTGIMAINIGAGGTGAKTISIGDGASTGTIAISSGSGGMTLDSTGTLELNSSAGVIGIGNDAVAQAINIGTGAAARTITVGNSTTSTSVVLTKGSSGNITLTGFNCSTYTSGGTLTTDSSGNITCANDDGGGGTWDTIGNPGGNLTLTMAAWTTTMNWTATGALNAWSMNLNNNSGTAQTQNLATLTNAVTSQINDINTESLLLLDNADTSTPGSTVVDNAILITNSGGIVSGVTDAIDASAAEIVNALNFGANVILGTTGNIDMNNFDVVGSTGNITTAGDLALNGGDITTTASTLNINLPATGGTLNFRDGTNNLVQITDQGTTGRLAVSDSLQVGGTSTLAYSRFGGTGTTGHSGYISTFDDLLISGDLELDGGFYLDSGSIYNAQGTGTILFCTTGGANCATTSQIENKLTTGSWIVDNALNVGKAALFVIQEKGGDIFTASAGASTKFTIANDGNVTINGSGTMLTVGGGTGKINVGTVDPVYSIGGDKFATYMAGMVGVKEEITGLIEADEYVPGVGYKHVIDFKNVDRGSDLWLFTKTTDMQNNIDKMVVLLTPGNNAKVWYELDKPNYVLSVYSSEPTTVSYRFTAPRFDSTSWTNENTDIGSTGFQVDDTPLTPQNGAGSLVNSVNSFSNFEIVAQEAGYVLKKVGGNIVGGFEAVTNLIAANIKAGAVVTEELTTKGFYAFQGTVDHLLVTSGLVSPSVQTEIISPLAGKTDVVVQVGTATEPGSLVVENASGSAVAEISSEGNATFSGTVTSDQVVANEIKADKIYANQIIGENGTFADLSSATSSGITREEVEKLLQEAEINQTTLALSSQANIFTATESASLQELTLSDLYVTDQMVASNLSLSSTVTMGNDFIIGSTTDTEGNLGNTINTLTAPLQIQSLAMAPIEIMGGRIRIETNGDVAINGNLNVAGEIKSESLTLAPKTDSEFGNLLTLKDKDGLDIASIDASGAAKFKGLTTDSIIIAQGQDATPSATTGEITTNATAGKAIIPANISEIVIRNSNITNYTLVYVTPTSTTENNVLYVKSKNDGYFTVGFNYPLSFDVSFDWWFIQIQP